MAICPVLSKKGGEVECLQKRCAWWHSSAGGACSVTWLAAGLEKLQAQVPEKLDRLIEETELTKNGVLADLNRKLRLG